MRGKASVAGKGIAVKSGAGIVVPEDLKTLAQLLEGHPADEEIWSCVTALPKPAFPEAVKWLERVEADPEHCGRFYFYQQVASALYFRWASFDPVAAATAASAIRSFRNGEAIENSVLCAWMKRSPYRAYESTIESYGPPKLLNPVTGSDMFVRTWKTGDVLSNLARYPAKGMLLLGAYCQFCAMNPPRREALFRLLEENPRMANRDWARERLLISWAKFDPDAAAEEAKRMHLDTLVDQLKRTRKIHLGSFAEAADAETEAIKADLLERYFASPAALRDWELRQETRPVIARLGENELRAFNAGLADEDSEDCTDWRGMLKSMIGRQWSRLNPVAASMVLENGKWRSPGIDDWFRRDLSAARAWLDGTSFPPDAARSVAGMRRRMLEYLAERDFPAAMDLLGSMDLENRKMLLKVWSWYHAVHPGNRQRILAALEKEEDAELTHFCRTVMIQRLADRDVTSARDFVASLRITEEEKHELDSLALSSWAEDEPEKGLSAWIALGEKDLPECFKTPLALWCARTDGSQQAVQWVIALEPSSQKETLKEAMAGVLAGRGSYYEAANLSLCIADEDKRKSVSRPILQKWKERSLTGYMKWLSGLSEKSREAL